VAEGLARGSHSNRFRRRRDAGANSSKVRIPWKIRWDEAFIKPLLISQEGVFLFREREEVGAMDRESDMAEGDMGRLESSINISLLSEGNRGEIGKRPLGSGNEEILKRSQET
jgi:hypothetical protein